MYYQLYILITSLKLVFVKIINIINIDNTYNKFIV